MSSMTFDRTDNFVIDGAKLLLTCSACPEQYDVFQDGSQIGYLRLRHGYFSAEYPDCGGKEVYSAQPEGDGIFADGQEREHHLRAAVAALQTAARAP